MTAPRSRPMSSGALADLSATVDGTAFSLEDHEIATLLGAEVASAAPGVVHVTNNGTATVSVGLLVYAEPSREMTVELDRQRATAGQTVNVTVRLTGATASDAPAAAFVPADDETGEVSTDVTLTAQGGGVYTGSFAAPASGNYLVDTWLTTPELRTATAPLAVAD